MLSLFVAMLFLSLAWTYCEGVMLGFTCIGTSEIFEFLKNKSTETKFISDICAFVLAFKKKTWMLERKDL